MYTKHDLLTHLKALNIDPCGTLMVHLSCKAIGEVEGRGDAVLDVLMEYMSPGLLVMPSHTWANVGLRNPVMDVLHTTSCIGQLPEMFRKRPGVHRSLHPTHALAALGADAEAFVSGEEHIQSPCGVGGAYHKLWQRNAQILMIGVNFTRNTYIHGIEEWDGAEGTISPNLTDMYVINEEGRRLHTPQHCHSSRLSSDTFTKLEPDALQQGILTLGRFGDATTRLMRAVPLRELAGGRLHANPRYLMFY